VYFMPSTVVLAHRVYHTRGLAEPAQLDWQRAMSDLHGLPIPEPPQRLDSAQLVAFYHQVAEQEFGPETCNFCHESFQPSRQAERGANAVIKELLPSLQTIEWMDWFSPSHLGVSSHFVGTVAATEPTPTQE
ncbi:hypothetical protein FRC06_009177, partial [Ceratobasidium sp. 370]